MTTPDSTTMSASPLDTLLRTLELLAFESDDAKAATAAIRDLFTAQASDSASNLTHMRQWGEMWQRMCLERSKALRELRDSTARLRAERDALNEENDLLAEEATAALALFGTVREALDVDRPDAEKITVLRRAIAGIFAPAAISGAPREP